MGCDMKQYKCRKRAQSLIETAVFGAVVLSILGTLVSYGLKYNFQQRTVQRTFRKALASASADMRGSTYILTEDKQLPHPSDPFGVGSVEGFNSSESIIRNYRMDKTADKKEELPKIEMEFQGNESRKEAFYTAAFREDFGVTEEQVEKYREIYGDSSIDWDEDSGSVEIIDPYSGENISYGGAVRICRMIVDEAVCTQECTAGRWQGEDAEAYDSSCEEICAQPMNIPWYCRGYTEINSATHRYNFPVLEQLFSYAMLSGKQFKPKAMGVQPETTQVEERGDTLTVNQSGGTITSRDDFNWSFTTNRDIIYHPYGDESGSYASKGVSTVKGRNYPNEWQTSY